MAARLSLFQKSKIMKNGSFAVPEGLSIPEGTEAGDEFEVLATCCLNEDGTISVKALDGNPVPSYSEEESQSEPVVEEEGFMEAVSRQM